MLEWFTCIYELIFINFPDIIDSACTYLPNIVSIFQKNSATLGHRYDILIHGSDWLVLEVKHNFSNSLLQRFAKICDFIEKHRSERWVFEGWLWYSLSLTQAFERKSNLQDSRRHVIELFSVMKFFVDCLLLVYNIICLWSIFCFLFILL